MPRSKKHSPFMRHKGIDIFEAYKGEVSKSPPFFGLFPNQQIEGSMTVFDLRRIPKRYLIGSERQPAEHRSGALEDLEQERLDVQNSLRRAIDDDYDFVLACRGRYGQWWRRIMRRLGRPVPLQRGLTEDIGIEDA